MVPKVLKLPRNVGEGEGEGGADQEEEEREEEGNSSSGSRSGRKRRGRKESMKDGNCPLPFFSSSTLRPAAIQQRVMKPEPGPGRHPGRKLLGLLSSGDTYSNLETC